MRATEKKLRDRHARLPEQYKKVDTTVNGDAENLIEERRQLEKNLVPLRLSNTTVIYVTRDKQNEAYAAVARKRMGIAEPGKHLLTLFHKRTLQKCTKRTA